MTFLPNFMPICSVTKKCEFIVPITKKLPPFSSPFCAPLPAAPGGNCSPLPRLIYATVFN